MVGSTGSGKSTCVPLWLSHDAQNTNLSARVICVQPRRVAVVSLARHVSQLMGLGEVGSVVGYRIRGEIKDSDSCKIVFVTCGYLRTALACDPNFLDSASHVVLDEAHERSLDADFLFFKLRSLLENVAGYSKLRLVIMSATIHTEAFQEYFGNLSPTPVPVVELSLSLSHTVSVDYLEDLDHQFPDLVSDVLELEESRQGFDSWEASAALIELTCKLIVTRSTPGMSTLVFLPGESTIDAVEKRLWEVTGASRDQWDIHVLHSLVPIEDQRKALKRPAHGLGHHVVLATNIAESSLTVEGVDLVIDTGFRKEAVFDPVRGFRSLRTVWASRANICQRKGRTGRVCDGKVIRLFSRRVERECMSDYETPEALNSNPVLVFLNAKFLCDRWRRYGFRLTPSTVLGGLMTPLTCSWERTLENLCSVGILQQNSPLEEAKLTIFGSLASWLQLEPEQAKLVFLGIVFGCPIEGIVLAAAAGMERDIFKFSSKFQPFSESKYSQRVISSILHRIHYDAGFSSELIMLRNLLLSSLLHRSRHSQNSNCVYAPQFLTAGIHLGELDSLKSMCQVITRGVLDWLAVATDSLDQKEDERERGFVSRDKIDRIFDSLENSQDFGMLDSVRSNLVLFMDMVNNRKRRCEFSSSDLARLFLPLRSYEEGDLLKLMITLSFGTRNLISTDASFPRRNGEAMTVKRTWNDADLGAGAVVRALTGGIEPAAVVNEGSKVSLVLGGLTEPEMDETQLHTISFNHGCEYSSVLCGVGLRIILAAFDKVWKLDVGIGQEEIAKISKPYIYNICRWFISTDRVYLSHRNPVGWLETSSGFYEGPEDEYRNSDARRSSLSRMYFGIPSRVVAGSLGGSSQLRAEGTTVLPIRKRGRVALALILCATQDSPVAEMVQSGSIMGLNIDTRFPVQPELVDAIQALKDLVWKAIRFDSTAIKSLVSLFEDTKATVDIVMELANRDLEPCDMEQQLEPNYTSSLRSGLNAYRIETLKAEVEFHFNNNNCPTSISDLASLVDAVYDVYDSLASS